MANSDNEKIKITVEDALSDSATSADVQNVKENNSERRKKTAIFAFLSLFCLLLLFLSLFFAYKNSEIKREKNLKSFKENISNWTKISEKEHTTENNMEKNGYTENIQSYDEYRSSLTKKEMTSSVYKNSYEKEKNKDYEPELKEKNTRRTGDRFNINLSPKISFGSKNKGYTQRQNLTEKTTNTETNRNIENQKGFFSNEISENLVSDRKTMLIHSISCPKAKDISETRRMEFSKDEIDDYTSHGYNFCSYCKCREYKGE